MTHKKGQAAMEFLMTYGWAILVLLLVVGALFYVIFVSFSTIDNCSCSNTEYKNYFNSVDKDNITYIQCYTINENIDFENQVITFSNKQKLFKCVNNTMVST